VSPRGDRGKSGEQYEVTTAGEGSVILPRNAAMDRGQKHGGELGKTVEVRRLRAGRSSVLVAAWKDGRQTR
jgi:hypothetical protein